MWERRIGIVPIKSADALISAGFNGMRFRFPFEFRRQQFLLFKCSQLSCQLPHHKHKHRPHTRKLTFSTWKMRSWFPFLCPPNLMGLRSPFTAHLSISRSHSLSPFLSRPTRNTTECPRTHKPNDCIFSPMARHCHTAYTPLRRRRQNEIILAFANCLALRKSDTHATPITATACHGETQPSTVSAPILVRCSRFDDNVYLMKLSFGTSAWVSLLQLMLPAKWVSLPPIRLCCPSILENRFTRQQTNVEWNKKKIVHNLTQWKSAMVFWMLRPKTKKLSVPCFFVFLFLCLPLDCSEKRRNSCEQFERENQPHKRHIRKKEKNAAVVIMTWIVLSLFDLVNHAACHIILNERRQHKRQLRARQSATATSHNTHCVYPKPVAHIFAARQ